MEATLNPSVRLYALIRSKSDEATANEAVTILEEVVKEKVITETKQLATKSDLLEGLTGVRKEIMDIRKEIAEGKTDVIKWMFIFWVGQIGVLSAILFAFLKLYFHQ